MGKKEKKIFSFGRIVQRNKIVRKVGLDTDNSFSWMENEKLTWNYKPAIVREGNFLYVNYIVFSELLNVIRKRYPNQKVDYMAVLKFLRRNRIRPIKKKDVDTNRVNETFNLLKNEREKNKWPAEDNDLKIISVYYVAGIDCMSTNNVRHFQGPCNFLGINLDFPPIIEPGSGQDVKRMLRDLYGKYNKKRRN